MNCLAVRSRICGSRAFHLAAASSWGDRFDKLESFYLVLTERGGYGGLIYDAFRPFYALTKMFSQQSSEGERVALEKSNSFRPVTRDLNRAQVTWQDEERSCIVPILSTSLDLSKK